VRFVVDVKLLEVRGRDGMSPFLMNMVCST